MSGKRRTRGELLTSVVLVLLLFRAYVPVGFMPAAGSPFRVELCPEASPVALPMAPGMPMPMASGSMPMPAHAHGHAEHAGTHGHFAHCPFGSAPAAGPLSHHLGFVATHNVATSPDSSFESLCRGVRAARAHLPRGPPAFV